jgi:predicted protein tyrosine phosphatase
VQVSQTETSQAVPTADAGASVDSRPCCPRLRSARWPLLVLLIGLAAYAGIQWYWNHQANWGTVVPGQIFRSATVSRHLIRRKLADNKIGVIVFLSRDTGDDADLAAERKIAADSGIKFLNFPMNGDGVAAPEQYTAALAAVCQAKAEGKPVLIHCHSGAQRTGGVVAMYRLLVEGKAPSEAYAEMRHYGYDPARNTTLMPFLNEHISQWAQSLAELKIIPHTPQPLPKLAP